MSKAIKGMNRDLTCRGHQFAVGETYQVAGTIKVCANGFHSCPLDSETSPLAVFEYYTPGTSRYFDVQFSGATDRDGTKIASASITIGAEIHLGELTTRAVEWVISKCKPAKGKGLNTEDFKLASNSGDGGAASNSGTHGAASNSGTHGAASNSGYGGAASNSGDGGAASNSGTHGAASNSGDGGAAISHARYGKVMGEVSDTVLYCTEIDDNGKIVSCAKGITGRGKIKVGTWYRCKGGKLVPVK